MGGTALAYFPVRHDWTWQSMAACRGMDTAIFYHPENERGPTRHRREWEAKRICQACPVVGPCLQWALRPANRTASGAACPSRSGRRCSPSSAWPDRGPFDAGGRRTGRRPGR